MLKNKKIDKFLVLLIALVTATLLLAVVPQSPCSIIKILRKYHQLDQAYQTINANTNSIREMQNRLKNLQTQSQQYRQKKQELEKQLNNMDLDAHMPSILILLEQNADYFGLDLNIAYGQIKEMTVSQQTQQTSEKKTPQNGNKASQNNQSTVQNQQSTTNDSVATSQQQTSNSSSNVPKSTAGQNTEQSGENTLEGQINKIMEAMENLIPNSNVSVTVIPIQIKGTYTAARDYLNFLDQVDFIEPAHIEITSSGKEVEVLVMLYVFHNKGGNR